MPITENIVRYIRRIASPVLSGPAPDVAEIVADATTNTLVFQSGGTKVAMDLSNTQTVSGDKTFSGAVTLSGTTTLSGTAAFTGATTGVRDSVSVTAADTIAITAAQSGTTFIATKATATQVFTLPLAATAGLMYRFVCAHASGEIRVGVGTGDNIIGKTHGAENGTGILTTASTGLLLNTAASNVVGDHTILVSDGITTWYMVSVAGVWSAA